MSHSPMASLVLTDSSQLTSDSQHLEISTGDGWYVVAVLAIVCESGANVKDIGAPPRVVMLWSNEGIRGSYLVVGGDADREELRLEGDVHQAGTARRCVGRRKGLRPPWEYPCCCYRGPPQSRPHELLRARSPEPGSPPRGRIPSPSLRAGAASQP
uniref:(California timema) hypothetical protein n=1 Tax=Timema californicum TaxID=61474 RepID=A0A7R9J3N4_TIMCA|nr:unnamed protein product [Timema californicum]